MRLVLPIVLICCLLGASASAAPVIAPAPQPWLQTKVATLRQRSTSALRALRDPEIRHKLGGKVVIAGGALIVGELLDATLQRHGMPAVASAFVAGAGPTVLAHYAQRGLHNVAGGWFDAPPKYSVLRVAGEAAFAGSIGMVGQIGLSKLGTLLDRQLPSDYVGALGRQGARLGVSASKNLVAGVRWGVRKLGDSFVNKAAAAGRKRVSADTRWSRAHMQIATGTDSFLP